MLHLSWVLLLHEDLKLRLSSCCYRTLVQLVQGNFPDRNATQQVATHDDFSEDSSTWVDEDKNCRTTLLYKSVKTNNPPKPIIAPENKPSPKKRCVPNIYIYIIFHWGYHFGFRTLYVLCTGTNVYFYRMIHNVHISLVFLGFVVIFINTSSRKKNEAARRVGIQSSNASCLQEAECTCMDILFAQKKRHSRYKKNKKMHLSDAHFVVLWVQFVWLGPDFCCSLENLVKNHGQILSVKILIWHMFELSVPKLSMYF